MRRGVGWWIAGFIIGLIGALMPLVGWPLMIIGALMIIYGVFRFFFGAAAGVAKVGAAGVRAATTKEVRK